MSLSTYYCLCTINHCFLIWLFFTFDLDLTFWFSEKLAVINWLKTFGTEKLAFVNKLLALETIQCVFRLFSNYDSLFIIKPTKYIKNITQIIGKTAKFEAYIVKNDVQAEVADKCIAGLDLVVTWLTNYVSYLIMDQHLGQPPWYSISI